MNSLPKPVVVGIVDEQTSALRFAIDEARSTASPLWVVHSVSTVVPAGDVYASFDVIERMNEAGQRVLDGAEAVVGKLAPHLETRYILASEAPLRALELASSTARVLVLGADDIPWFDRLLRTRIAGYLALHAPCPVVAVPEGRYASDREGDLVLALDGETSADGPIRFAFDEANFRDAVLHVLHAAPPGSDSVDAARANIAEVLAGWREKFPDVMILEGCVADKPEAAVLRATESAALVIVGRPHDRALTFGVARSLASIVLRHAHGPVAVVPAAY